MSKHTPGPWTHTEFGVSGHTVRGNALVADCYNRLIDTSEMKANVRLIAAAPDTASERDRLKATCSELVEALESVLEVLDGWPERFEFAKEVLANAEGGKQ